MPYLIDGHNLIPKLPGVNLGDIDDEQELVKLLQGFCRQSGKRVEVYFDNAPAGQARTQRFGTVTAHFIRRGRTADAAITARLRNLGRSARNWTVVSSDRAVQNEARAFHANVIPAEKFAENISGKRDKTGGVDQGDPGAVEEISLSPDEIHGWMELFDPDNNQPDE